MVFLLRSHCAVLLISTPPLPPAMPAAMPAMPPFPELLSLLASRCCAASRGAAACCAAAPPLMAGWLRYRCVRPSTLSSFTLTSARAGSSCRTPAGGHGRVCARVRVCQAVACVCLYVCLHVRVHVPVRVRLRVCVACCSCELSNRPACALAACLRPYCQRCRTTGTEAAAQQAALASSRSIPPACDVRSTHSAAAI